MDKQIIISNITGSNNPPYEIYLCEPDFTSSCSLIDTINDNELPYTFQVPSLSASLQSYGVVIIDQSNCQLNTLINIGSPTPTPTPTPIPPPECDCFEINILQEYLDSASGNTLYSQYDNIVLLRSLCEDESICEYCDGTPFPPFQFGLNSLNSWSATGVYNVCVNSTAYFDLMIYQNDIPIALPIGSLIFSGQCYNICGDIGSEIQVYGWDDGGNLKITAEVMSGGPVLDSLTFEGEIEKHDNTSCTFLLDTCTFSAVTLPVSGTIVDSNTLCPTDGAARVKITSMKVNSIDILTSPQYINVNGTYYTITGLDDCIDPS